ncbi:MAG: acetate--CoA ligase family protein [Actinomycetes bacterium]
MDLSRLLAPRSVAVVGATERTGSYGAVTMRNLLGAGFGGRLVPVNPSRATVFDVPCVASLVDLDEPVDAVVVATPADTVPGLLDQIGASGCGGAVVYAAEFAETGRTDRQKALVDTALGHRLPVIGPNANGLVSVTNRAPLWGDTVTLGRSGGIALVSQSGNLGVSALASQRGIRWHTVVSVGNQAVVSAADVLLALPQLDGVRSVALYLEDDGDGRVLAEALAACAEQGVGVVVLKAGRSAAGALAGGAHTAAVAGDHKVFAALIDEAGGVMVDDPNELLEVAKALASPRPTRHGGLAVMTCSGGDSVIVADEADRLGVALASFSQETVARLQELLPNGVVVTNPLDHTNALWDDADALASVAGVITQDPGVAQLLYVQDTPPDLATDFAAEWKSTRDGAARGAATDVPVAVASGLPELMPQSVAEDLADQGVLPLLGLPSGLLALSAAKRPPGSPARLRNIAATVTPARDAGEWLAEHDGKALLARHGISVPEGAVAHTVDEAVELAQRLAVDEGSAVVAKLSHPDVQHKSDIGGVALGLATSQDVRREAERMLAVAPHAALLVERMSSPGVELLVAARSDGVVPTLVVGLGGIWTEVFDDTVVVPLPADPARVTQALLSLKGAPLLTGGRGSAQVALESVAALASAVGQVLIDEALSLIELNPVVVTADDAVALDAAIRR